MSDQIEKRVPRRRRLIPQYSLAALFVVMTLASIGAWYWYQRPFEVRNIAIAPSDEADAFATPTATGQGAVGSKQSLPYTPANLRKLEGFRDYLQVEVVSVRRVWSRDRKTVPHGPRRIYDGHEVLRLEGYYQNGVKHGRFVQYSATGKRSGEEFYDRGELDGPRRHWDAAGTLLEEASYKRGEKHGQFRRWSATGELLEETNYDRGRKQGRFFQALVSGPLGVEPKPQIEGAYDQGLPNGPWQWKQHDSSYSVAVHWRDGLPDGAWECSEADGKASFAGKFDRGQLLSSTTPINGQLQAAMARAARDDPEVFYRLLAPCTPEFVQTPAKDAMTFLQDSTAAAILVGPVGEIALTHRDRLKLPLVAALGQLLPPHGLACDYRFGVLWIDRPESIAQWKDRTGLSAMRLPPGSPLAKKWDRVPQLPWEFVETPFHNALSYLKDAEGTGLEFDVSALPPAAMDQPITLNLRRTRFKHCLGLLLDQTHCRVSLRGETLVITPQAE